MVCSSELYKIILITVSAQLWTVTAQLENDALSEKHVAEMQWNSYKNKKDVLTIL
jgi:hypothetical protein